MHFAFIHREVFRWVLFRNILFSLQVVYPLQTISKNELMDFGNTPLFIEAANSDSLQKSCFVGKKFVD